MSGRRCTNVKHLGINHSIRGKYRKIAVYLTDQEPIGRSPGTFTSCKTAFASQRATRGCCELRLQTSSQDWEVLDIDTTATGGGRLESDPCIKHIADMRRKIPRRGMEPPVVAVFMLKQLSTHAEDLIINLYMKVEYGQGQVEKKIFCFTGKHLEEQKNSDPEYALTLIHQAPMKHVDGETSSSSEDDTMSEIATPPSTLNMVTASPIKI